VVPYVTYGFTRDHVYPFPSVADAGFLGYAPPLAVALLLRSQHGGPADGTGRTPRSAGQRGHDDVHDVPALLRAAGLAEAGGSGLGRWGDWATPRQGPVLMDGGPGDESWDSA